MEFNVNYTGRQPRVIREKSILGHDYTLTDEYLLKDGEPYIYTMGELHFSRMNENDWEKELVKMKNGGIDIVSSYLFWNHHENRKGVFDFSGNRDLRKFAGICEKLGMPFFLRIGPWVNAEARNGGFPDWLKNECPAKRCNDEKYLYYVERYYREIYGQIEGCGNIIGIQIENEYTKGRGHLQYLYDTARRIGFDALIFSATGWDNAVVPDCLVPMFGAYPEYPWVQENKVYDDGRVYGFFNHDAAEYWARIDEERKYPVFTCELGAGNQSTYCRRPIIKPWEIASLTVLQLGTGCKGLGYYMYHGGSNPVAEESGKILETFQAGRGSGSGSDCPVVSYDFQSPLGDCGQYRESYFELGALLSFVRCEERRLAVMSDFRPSVLPGVCDMLPLRASVLSDGNSGFLFYINCFHGHALPCKNDTADIKLENETLTIPLSVPENAFGIIPFNYRVGDEILKWVKAYPVKKDGGSVTFATLKGTEPVYMKTNGECGNLRDVEFIGGKRIILTDNVCPQRKDGEKLAVREVPTKLPFDIFAHIIFGSDGRLSDLTKEYSADIPDGVSYVSVKAEGNTGAAYEEINENSFRLISDHFLDGDEWIVDVRNVGKLRLKIQPFTESDRGKIYLEKEFVTGDFVPEVSVFGEDDIVRTPQ